MANSQPATPSPLVRFPRFTDLGDLNSLSVVIQDLSTIYDVTTTAVLPGYAEVRMPTTRIGPRRRTPLRVEDKLQVKRISLASPLEIAFAVVESSAALGVVAGSFTRVARAAKAWLDVLAAGQDFRQRELALEESRALAPERLREAQLRNALLEQQVRLVTARPELVERARDGHLTLSPNSGHETATSRSGRHRRTAGSMTAPDFAELLDEPMQRLLGYAGGELEVAGDEGGTRDEPQSS